MKQIITYFAGIIEESDEEGIIIRQFNSNLKTYISRKHIVGIAEEQMLDPDNPEDKEVIDKIKEKSVQINQGDTVDPEALASLSKFLQNKHGH